MSSPARAAGSSMSAAIPKGSALRVNAARNGSVISSVKKPSQRAKRASAICQPPPVYGISSTAYSTLAGSMHLLRLSSILRLESQLKGLSRFTPSASFTQSFKKGSSCQSPLSHLCCRFHQGMNASGSLSYSAISPA